MNWNDFCDAERQYLAMCIYRATEPYEDPNVDPTELWDGSYHMEDYEND